MATPCRVIPSIARSAADHIPQSPNPAGRTTRRLAKTRVLNVSPTPEDDVTLRRILDGLVWEVSTVFNCRDAIEQMCGGHFSVVFCEGVLEDGTWKDILNQMTRSDDPPLLIVTSRLADEYLWAEVLNLGGYDVLAKPFHQREVSHVLTSASLRLAHSAAATSAAGAA